MKFNWGTGIVIAFVAFISFIMYFVINMNTNKRYDHDLVTEDYYGQELKYQNDIDKERNAKLANLNLSWQKTTQGLLIKFPESLEAHKVKGNVFLYRPSNKQFDFETPISLSNHTLLIPDKRLLGGRWNISVDWTYEEQSYLFKDNIMY